MTRCLVCTAAWGGANTAHCSGCHETFTGVTAFDRHRKGYGERGSCREPVEAGLVDAGRGYAAWTMPGSRDDN